MPRWRNLVDAHVSGVVCVSRHAGSSPALGILTPSKKESPSHAEIAQLVVVKHLPRLGSRVRVLLFRFRKSRKHRSVLAEFLLYGSCCYSFCVCESGASFRLSSCWPVSRLFRVELLLLLERKVISFSSLSDPNSRSIVVGGSVDLVFVPIYLAGISLVFGWMHRRRSPSCSCPTLALECAVGVGKCEHICPA